MLASMAYRNAKCTIETHAQWQMCSPRIYIANNPKWLNDVLNDRYHGYPQGARAWLFKAFLCLVLLPFSSWQDRHHSMAFLIIALPFAAFISWPSLIFVSTCSCMSRTMSAWIHEEICCCSCCYCSFISIHSKMISGFMVLSATDGCQFSIFKLNLL